MWIGFSIFNSRLLHRWCINVSLAHSYCNRWFISLLFLPYLWKKKLCAWFTSRKWASRSVHFCVFLHKIRMLFFGIQIYWKPILRCLEDHLNFLLDMLYVYSTPLKQYPIWWIQKILFGEIQPIVIHGMDSDYSNGSEADKTTQPQLLSVG